MGDDVAARSVIESLGNGSAGMTLAQMLKRPEIQIEQLAPVLAKLMPGFFVRQGIVSEEVSSFEFPVSSKRPVILSEERRSRTQSKDPFQPRTARRSLSSFRNSKLETRN